MKAVNISELRKRLSFYLAKVKNGEVIVISERGVPFAKILPIGNTDRHEAGPVKRDRKE